MANPVVTLRVSPDLLEKIDKLRGERSRSAFIIEAIETTCSPSVDSMASAVGGGGQWLLANGGSGGGYGGDGGGPIIVQQTVKRRSGQVQPRWKKPKGT